ncbi:hypothetical protein FGRMN_2893 [Fusarium graminum]|nr:hypothetical protein FGRMN_2893 [Fusarium graminum]
MSSTPTKSGSMQQEKSLTFDKYGDLKLTVGTNPSQEMLVDSHVLRRTSSIFCKMLCGPFVERKPEQGDWKIALPEDDNKAFALLMDMAHGLYVLTAGRLEIDKMYKLCILTNKYDMVSVLRPMEPRWSKRITLKSKSIQCQSETYRKSMFILLELGHANCLTAMIDGLIRGCPTDDRGDFVDENNIPLKKLEPFHMPTMSNMLERAADGRRDSLAQFEARGRTFTRSALKSSFIWTLHCKCQPERDRDASMGRMLSKALELGIMGLFLPLVGEPKMTMSISSLLGKFEEVKEAVRGERCACDVLGWLKYDSGGHSPIASLTKAEEAYMEGQAIRVQM